MADAFNRVGGASSIATGEQVGQAYFSLFADAGPLITGLDKAQQSAQRVSQMIGQSLGRNSQAGMGLLYLGQAIDDVQYGFRAIVNNIPQMAMAFGAGAGLAGGIGIAAVAINQFTQHWEELMDSFDNSSMPIDKARSNLEKLADALTDSAGVTGLMPALGGLARFFAGGQDLQAEQARNQAAEAKLAGKGKGLVEDTLSADEQAQHDKFMAAMKDYGPGRLFNEMVQQRVGGQNLTPSQIQSIKDEVHKQIAMVATGRETMGVTPQAFQDKAKQIEEFRFRDEQRKIEKQGEENTKRFQEQRFRDGERQMEEEMARVKASWEERKRQQIKDVETEIKDKNRKARDLEEQARSVNPSRVFGGTHEFANAMMTGALGAIEKEQLAEAKGIRKGVEKLHDKLDNIRDLRWPD